MTPFIQLQAISKIYENSKVGTEALSKVSLTVNQKDFIALMGASGSGKSTLLHVLGMLDLPTTGQYIFQGQDISTIKFNQRAILRKFNIGYVFQDFNLIDDLNIFDNVELPLIYLKVNKKERLQKVNAILERLSLLHKADQFPDSLSGGQQQRVALARAVVVKPKLILADEPTGNLDSDNGNEVMEILSELNQEGTTVIMATHNFNDAAYAKRLVKLLDGKIVSENRSLHVA